MGKMLLFLTSFLMDPLVPTFRLFIYLFIVYDFVDAVTTHRKAFT